MTVLHYLEETAQRFPDKYAISDNLGSYTFSELRDNAISIAGHISKKLGGQAHSAATRLPILVYLPKCKECIAAFLGIVYSGNIYTPTDVRYPFVKVQSIIDVLEPALYISDKENAKKLRKNGISNKQILIFENICTKGNFDTSKALSSAIDTDPVYILFTSGSTGVPKGVVICHRSIVDYMEWMAGEFKIDETTVMGSQAPFYFDISVPDIYLCLKTGARLYIIPEQYFSFPEKLMQLVAMQQINFIFWVPSMLSAVANSDILSSVDCSHLKYIFFGGEVMPNKQLNYWRQHIPGAIYSNLYGPTEITGTCIYYTVDREFSDDEPLPIGIPCGNTGILLLDKDGNLVTKPDIQGEICIRGSSLSHGYWNNPEKTAEVFCQNPLNTQYPEIIYRTGDLAHYNEKDELMFDGRRDFQVKHFGYRIELGEIETAASGIDGVCAASADYDRQKREIVLFYAGDVEKRQLHKSLLMTLPKYMVPSRYTRLNAFPYNDNGKINRIELRKKHLKEPRHGRTAGNSA